MDSEVQGRLERAKPPYALVTTPESLSVMLSRAEVVATLREVRAVIVDEWREFLSLLVA